jgi:alpha-beta hydrolase superfamily lysophospholipase
VFLFTWYRLYITLHIHAKEDIVKVPPGWDTTLQFVNTIDNQKIAYWYFPVKNSKAVVILVHGYSNPGGKSQMIWHAKYLNASGYSTVLPDLRGYGSSSGHKMTLGVDEWKDIEAVFDDVKAKNENKDKKIGFLGISMGAVSSIVACGKTGKGDFVIASVPYAGFDTLFPFQIQSAGFPSQIIYPFMKIAALIELGRNYEKYTPKATIQKIQVPILLIGATRDKEVPPQDAEKLFTIAHSPKELWIVDAGHDVYDEKKEEFESKVLNFLVKYITK